MAKNFLMAAIQIVIGIVLIATGIGAPAGVALIIGGVFQAAAIALAPDASEATTETADPTYGFDQFKNPAKGDTPIPVIYSAEGHKMAPVWLQAFVSPRGLGDQSFERKHSQTQQLSGLLALGEGPITDIEELRFNDEPVFTKILDYKFGVGDGSKREWTLPQGKILLDSVEVAVNGVVKGWVTANASERLATGNNSTTTWSFTLPTNIAEEVPIRLYNRNPNSSAGYTNDMEPWRITGVQIWLVEENRVILQRDEPIGSSVPIFISYGVRKANGLTIRKNSSGRIVVKFNSAPASGAKLTATMLRKNIQKVDVTIRRGSAHQLPIWGFHEVRNSFGVQSALDRDVVVSKDTKDEVDDIIVNVSSSESGFIRFTDENEPRGVKAQFTIALIRQNSTGNGNTFDTEYVLPDPRGSNAATNKNSVEYQVGASSINQQFWSFSIRGLLEAYAKDQRAGTSKKRAADKAVQDFKRGLYTVRLKRTNPVASDTNTSYYDDLLFSSITEVRNEALNLPGTALLGFHALGTERLHGGAPNVTVIQKGIREVESLEGAYDTWTPDPANQSNRVWAAIDLITNPRYGCGEHYTKEANIDYESAKECAAWLDEQVSVGDNTDDEEVRSCLDIVLSTRKPLMEHLRMMLAPGRIWAFQRGNVWHFVKDDAVTLQDYATGVLADVVPVVYDDGRSARTAQKSLKFSHDTVVSRPTEVQVTYLDEEEEFQPKQVWAAIEETSTEPRRIRRATAWGVLRLSEATRYALWLWSQLRVQGTTLSVGLAPRAIEFGVGDVIRVISNRVGIDGWWRVHEMDFSTDSFFVRVVGKQYVPSNYGQQHDKHRILRDGFARLAAVPPPTIRSPSAGAPAVASARTSTGDEAAATVSSPRRDVKKSPGRRTRRGRRVNTVKTRRIA